MTEDKSKLLRSLTIDRSASKAERSGSRWLPISAAIVACVVAFAAFGAYEFREARPAQRDRIADRSNSRRRRSPRHLSRPAASNKAAGNLAASGYVVARRKATVAAEITGKVVEVFIDEGMTVTEGQVVARLDSVLAERDYELAPSRASRRPMPRLPRSPPIWRTRRGSCRGCKRCRRRISRPRPTLTKAQARVGVLSAQLRQAQSQFETAKIDAKRSASVLDKHQDTARRSPASSSTAAHSPAR